MMPKADEYDPDVQGGALPADPRSVALFTPSSGLLSKLKDLGVDIGEMEAPTAPLFWKHTWEELCDVRTRDPKIMLSPIMVVVKVNAFPEAKAEYDDYTGYVYVEAVTDDEECVSFTTSYAYAETGEKLPLSEHLTKQPPPFPLRVGRFATRKPNQFVIKPVPVDINR